MSVSNLQEYQDKYKHLTLKDLNRGIKGIQHNLDSNIDVRNGMRLLGVKNKFTEEVEQMIINQQLLIKRFKSLRVYARQVEKLKKESKK